MLTPDDIKNAEAAIIDDGGPAFPFTPTDRSGQIGESRPGLSVRDWLAGLALQGWLANSPKIRGENMSGTSDHAEVVAKAAYIYADAMLAAREATP